MTTKGMSIADFKAPDDAVTGRWFDVGEGLRVKVARAGNQKFEDYVGVLMKPHTRQQRRGKVKAGVIRSITKKAMARVILLDWENMLDADGKAVVYSEQKAFEYLTDYHDFFKMIEVYSATFASDEDELEEDAEGNLGGSSGGSSGGEEIPSTSNSSSDAPDAGDQSPPLTPDQNSTPT